MVENQIFVKHVTRKEYEYWLKPTGETIKTPYFDGLHEIMVDSPTFKNDKVALAKLPEEIRKKIQLYGNVAHGFYGKFRDGEKDHSILYRGNTDTLACVKEDLETSLNRFYNNTEINKIIEIKYIFDKNNMAIEAYVTWQ